MPIVGTAGHVDHGKSALVAALTGTNPDRWREERLRGMTLDLGFAHLRLDGGLEAGIVDVPGHERFLHNMLAGAAGMDVLLLVVAADEGVMPQTREHLDILRYLNVRETIVAMSKADLVAGPARVEAFARIAHDLRGTPADGAPAVAVSSVTGEGLAALRERIAGALRALPPRDANAPAYLPIDRVFVLAGRGTIVTGTLMQGSVAVGDGLVLEPSGKRARVRSIEIFGDPRARASAGSRVALNLAGVEHREIARGETAVGGAFHARSNFAVRFTPLPEAVGVLRRRTPVRAYLGSAEVLGTLVFERAPGDAGEVRARLELRRPAAAFPGVRFVVRRPSPKTLLGGGCIEGVAADAAGDAPAPAEAALLALLRERGLAAVEAADAAFAANLREDVAAATLEALAEREDVLRVRRPTAYVDAAAALELLASVRARLDETQRGEPWAMGMTSVALSRAVDVAEPLLVRMLSAFADSGRIGAHAGYYATLDHRPAPTAQQRALFEEVLTVDAARPCVPVAFAQVVSAVRRSGIAGAPKAFDTLLATGALVKVGEDLYRSSQIAAVRARLESYFRFNETMTAAEFRDAIGSSRKYAVPLLEWLDAAGVTVRNGDRRMLRENRKPTKAGGWEGDPPRAW